MAFQQNDPETKERLYEAWKIGLWRLRREWTDYLYTGTIVTCVAAAFLNALTGAEWLQIVFIICIMFLAGSLVCYAIWSVAIAVRHWCKLRPK